MARCPDPVLLESGEILAPYRRDGDKQWRMTRIGVDDDRYADGLNRIQRNARYDARASILVGLWWFTLSWIVVSFAIGLIVAAVLSATGTHVSGVN